MLGFVNQAFTTGYIPERWKTLIMARLPTSGDIFNPSIFRGISLISLVMKLHNKMIMNRLRPALDLLLRNPKSDSEGKEVQEDR